MDKKFCVSVYHSHSCKYLVSFKDIDKKNEILYEVEFIDDVGGGYSSSLKGEKFKRISLDDVDEYFLFDDEESARLMFECGES